LGWRQGVLVVEVEVWRQGLLGLGVVVVMWQVLLEVEVVVEEVLLGEEAMGSRFWRGRWWRKGFC
jgi:hypothetical protein